MLIDITEKEARIILSCLEATDMLYMSRKKDNKDLISLKQKVSKIAPQEARSNILADMIRG